MTTEPRSGRWGQVDEIDHRITALLDRLAPLQADVVGHPMYSQLDDLGRVQTFMEHHVFAVLDFMWLLKRLQRDLTCVEVPWVPVGSAATRHFINEIVVGEESDSIDGRRRCSHFELYLDAMEEVGADTGPICRFLDGLRRGDDVLDALAASGAPVPAQHFVVFTWSLVATAPTHEVAGAFAFGRENLIPEMFTALLELNERIPARLATLVTYLVRHIELDGDEHTPLAFGMLTELCGDAQMRWDEVASSAARSLDARRALWDGVTDEMTALARVA